MHLCKRILMIEEGFRDEVYFCTRGKPTIGYGHNLMSNPLTVNDYDALGLARVEPLKMTKAQAEVLLVRDINRLVVPAAHRLFGADFWVTMGEVRRAALGSMIYQMGEDGVGAFVNMRASIRRHDWPGAAIHAADSDWHNDPVNGTPERARRHVKAIRENKDVWS